MDRDMAEKKFNHDICGVSCETCGGTGIINQAAALACPTCKGKGYTMSKKNTNIRKFKTGASRDTNEGKNDYEGSLSPLVIKAYGDYMTKHRKMSDGSLRPADNWQKGFGDNHFSVCIKSAWRHFLDLWMEHRGYKSRETIDEAICGLLFNVMAYYHQLLVNRKKDK